MRQLLQPDGYWEIMLKKLNHKRGFTLLELLLSLATIGLLAGLSLPVYRTLITKNDLDIAATTIAQNLHRAQILSQAVDGDTSWGLKAQSGSIILFKGTSFTTRDSSFDETFAISTTINVAGLTEVVFSKFSALPQISGTTTLSTANDSRIITINEKGMVDY